MSELPRIDPEQLMQRDAGRLIGQRRRLAGMDERTRVATLFPNEDSCLRLVSAVAMEISDEWETGRVYLTMEQ